MNSAETSCIPNDTRINELLYSTTWLWFISVLICPDISVLSRRKPYSNQDYSSSTIRFIFAYFSLIEVLRFSPDICGTSGIISQILISERKIFSVLHYHSHIRNSSYISNRTEKLFPVLHHHNHIRNSLYISGWTARMLSLMVVWVASFHKFFFQKNHTKVTQIVQSIYREYRWYQS